ncbi:MAG: Maebl [Sphingomonadales bacterium BRH_c42]|nr:MAG: Maebl [Sphingomonadales bacterium BRH_c42]
MSDPRPERLAVLIDADNISPKLADELFEELTKIGDAMVRRIYGDFSTPNLGGWTNVMPKHAINAHQNFANIVGKNATDIALVIDAMDLLHSGRFDAFCLVSSDSDFTRLASRIREHGLRVYGFGERKSAESYRNACHRFIYLDNISSAIDEDQTEPSDPTKAPQPPSKARPLIAKAIRQLDPEGGWVSLSGVGSRMQELVTDFDYRTYGYPNLSRLVEKAGSFEIERRDNAGTWVRIKPKGTSA